MTHVAHRVYCTLCKRYIETLPIAYEMVPKKPDGMCEPPFHECSVIEERIRDGLMSIEEARGELGLKPLTDNPNFEVVKREQRIMSYTETRAMLERLGPLGLNILLKGASVN